MKLRSSGFILAALTAISPVLAASPERPTPDIIKQLLTPIFARNLSDTTTTTIEFKQIDIAPTRVALQAEFLGHPPGTKITPVLATFIVTSRCQYDAKSKPFYGVRQYTEYAWYYVDEFGKSSITLKQSSQNKEVQLKRNSPTP